MHSDGTDKTYFLSAWRLDFFGQPPSRGGGDRPPGPSRGSVPELSSSYFPLFIVVFRLYLYLLIMLPYFHGEMKVFKSK